MPEITTLLAVGIPLASAVSGYVGYLLHKERSKTRFKVGTEKSLDELYRQIDKMHIEINEIKKSFNDEVVVTKEEHAKMQQMYNQDIGKLEKKVDELAKDVHELRGYIKGRDHT